MLKRVNGTVKMSRFLYRTIAVRSFPRENFAVYDRFLASYFRNDYANRHKA
jgi:hypothetical protein